MRTGSASSTRDRTPYKRVIEELLPCRKEVVNQSLLTLLILDHTLALLTTARTDIVTSSNGSSPAETSVVTSIRSKSIQEGCKTRDSAEESYIYY